MQPLMLLAMDGVMRMHLPSAVREPRWPWLFSLSGLLYSSAFFGWPLSNKLAWMLHPVSNILFIVVLIGLMIVRYRQVDAEGRRRFKWIVYGIVFGTLPLLVANVVTWVEPNLHGTLDWCMLATVLVPMCLFIAMLRHRLFDIDRLISITATYSLIGIAVIAALLMFAPRVAHAASGATGVAAPTLQAWLSLAIAGLLLPGQKLLRPLLDRLFFRERLALENGMEQLLDDLSACGEPQALFELVGTRLDELIRPESCVLYSRTGRAFAPVFQRASAVPPAFAIDGDLIPMLGARRVALELGRQSRLPPDSVDRAALEALGAALLLPIHQHGELVAFVCLGHKRSGDVYIATDLALLGTVAQRVTVELQGFDAVHVRRQSEEMQSALRRYVPGAVAEHIEQGRELGAAECDITVLFVDIRGYTTYSEARSATEIFEMVNRYTEAVSTVVRRHGGTVVEFSGDGLMVVFGAPTAIPHKERAAVAAAREAVTTVRALALGAGKTADRGLDVGIGIASGSAFVGNIRAVDRMIWGAIGNTTNLAARLQNLSRDLGASIVIDAATRDADPGAAEDFQRHPQITIRGRQRREDVYALAL